MSRFIYETKDVSANSAPLMQDGIVKVAASASLNQLYGDPAPNIVKNLQISFGDGTQVSLPEVRHFDVSIAAKRPLEIIVARYNETLDWINDFEIFRKQCYTIYNKGPNQNFAQKQGNIVVSLKNIGRNDHTYLHHIVQNYGCLADVTVFFPGSLQIPFKFIEGVALLRKIVETGKAWMFASQCADLCEHFENFTLDKWMCSAQSNRSINAEESLTPAETRPLGQWYRKQYGTQLSQHYFFFGIFSVDRETILRRPLSFYQDILRQLSVSSNPEVGHYTERTWHAMFPGTSIIPLPHGSAFLYETVLIPRRTVFCCYDSCKNSYSDQIEIYDKKRIANIKGFDKIVSLVELYGDLASKPLVIAHALSNLNDGDLLCYCIPPENSIEICAAILSGNDYDNIVYKISNRIDGDYTKMDILKWFPNVEYASNQYSAAQFILKKTPEIVQLVDEWCCLAQSGRNYNFVSFEKNLPTFVHHDSESIFSLLMKRHNKSFVVENKTALYK